MAEQSTVQVGGKIHLALSKHVRHERDWVAAQREAGRLKRIADAIWRVSEGRRTQPAPSGEGM